MSKLNQEILNAAIEQVCVNEDFLLNAGQSGARKGRALFFGPRSQGFAFC